ncbi:MAG: hypothetical protein ABIE22_02770 [archaeon]
MENTEKNQENYETSESLKSMLWANQLALWIPGIIGSFSGALVSCEGIEEILANTYPGVIKEVAYYTFGALSGFGGGACVGAAVGELYYCLAKMVQDQLSNPLTNLGNCLIELGGQYKGRDKE